jgi:acid stress-induced BolA-like protein IbaG/YrbA
MNSHDVEQINITNEFVNHIYNDIDITGNMIQEYFGFNLTLQQQQALYGIYKDMIRYNNVDANTLYTYKKKGQLNQLIHSIFTKNPTPYYKIFCKNEPNLYKLKD